MSLPHHAFLLKELVKRDFQGRYAGSLLSFLWSFVQPLWLLGLYTFVFSVVLAHRAVRGGDRALRDLPVLRHPPVDSARG